MRSIPPKRLYKYRPFDHRTLEMLVEDTTFFADPTKFNDPLDTKPTLDSDIPNSGLKEVLAKLIEERTAAEMAEAAKIIRYKGPKTLEHIVRHSSRAAKRALQDITYDATDPQFEIDDPERALLSYYIQSELLRRYDKGVFSLAERANCPLMWSHYGDQHKGICLGYSVPEETVSHIHKMKYGGSRLVQASAVANMLTGNDTARKDVDEAVLLKKARPWAYEREWRLLGNRGTQHSPLELEEVIFGMRCPRAVIFSVVQALTERDRSVRFYEIRGKDGRFLLEKRLADLSELMALFPRRHLRQNEIFRDFSSEN